VLCLCVVLVALSFASGYLCGVLIRVSPADPRIFATSVFSAIGRADFANLLAKTVIPGLLTGTICVVEGLGVRGSITEVPQAATRAVVRSVAALFLVSAAVSVLTYA
jgi:phospholipid/cholesterol/gamma-HCH transport system permease protein